MSDNNVGVDPANSVELDEHTDDDIVGVDGGQGLTKRARVQRNLDQAYISAWNAAARASQRGLSQAGAAAWDATGRARSAAAARRTATPIDATPDTATTGTLVDRARAYRVHLLTGAAAAAAAVLVAVLRRRVAARRAEIVIDAIEVDAIEIEVSEMALNAEPLDD